MLINTTARHFELAREDRSFAHTRLEKFGRFASDISEIHLVVTAENHRYVAEATLRMKRRDLAVREEAADPRLAIDLVADRVEAQLRRIHEKRVDRKHTPDTNGLAGTASIPDDDDDELASGGED